MAILKKNMCEGGTFDPQQLDFALRHFWLIFKTCANWHFFFSPEAAIPVSLGYWMLSLSPLLSRPDTTAIIIANSCIRNLLCRLAKWVEQSCDQTGPPLLALEHCQASVCVEQKRLGCLFLSNFLIGTMSHSQWKQYTCPDKGSWVWKTYQKGGVRGAHFSDFTLMGEIILFKSANLSQMWWCLPVIPAL